VKIPPGSALIAPQITNNLENFPTNHRTSATALTHLETSATIVADHFHLDGMNPEYQLKSSAEPAKCSIAAGPVLNVPGYLLMFGALSINHQVASSFGNAPLASLLWGFWNCRTNLYNALRKLSRHSHFDRISLVFGLVPQSHHYNSSSHLDWLW
jgi:hypothetical protein